MMIAFPKATQAGPNGRDLEAWFGMENCNEIQNLHDHLKEMNETNLGGWDYTTVWDVRGRNYSFEGQRVVRLLTKSRKTGGVGSRRCPSHTSFSQSDSFSATTDWRSSSICLRPKDVSPEWLTKRWRDHGLSQVDSIARRAKRLLQRPPRGKTGTPRNMENTELIGYRTLCAPRSVLFFVFVRAIRCHFVFFTIFWLNAKKWQ